MLNVGLGLTCVCSLCLFIGGASEEEEEVGGRSGVSSAVGSVGSGYSSGHRPHLQHSEGRSALHSGIGWGFIYWNFLMPLPCLIWIFNCLFFWLAEELQPCVFIYINNIIMLFNLCLSLFQDGGHSGSVNSVQWHPNESVLYSGSDDTHIAEWDLKTGKTRWSVAGVYSLE